MSVSLDQILGRLERDGQAVLAEYLPRQRWFGAKGKRISRVRISDYARLSGTASDAVLTITTVEFNDGTAKKYTLPLVCTSSEEKNADTVFTLSGEEGAVQIRDGTADEDTCLKLVEGIRDSRRWQGQHGVFHGAPTALAASLLATPLSHSKRLSGEQSNTSIVFDRRLILKLIRSVDEGINPDREISEFLTTQAHYQSTPALIGSIEYHASQVFTSSQSSAATIGLLQAFIPNEGDGWSDALTQIKAILTDEKREQTAAERIGRMNHSADRNIRAMRRLGELTAELHVALSSDTTNPAFRPDRISEQDVAAWRTGMIDHTHALFAQLGTLSSTRTSELRLASDEIASLRMACLNALEDFNLLLADPVMKIRVHGDYHLGQVLKSGETFVILDFEGEPARTPQERRAKQCALKDVAGMRRSFHYAGHAARRELRAETSEAEQMTDQWTRLVSGAFWEGYTAIAKPGEAPFLPRTHEHTQRVLRLFELDKTVYEIGYELNHRPDWLAIPLNGLRAMFARQG